MPDGAGGMAGCATVFTQRNPRGRTAATQQARTILVTTEGMPCAGPMVAAPLYQGCIGMLGGDRIDGINCCGFSCVVSFGRHPQGITPDGLEPMHADGRQVVVTDGDLNAVPAEIRSEVHATHLKSALFALGSLTASHPSVDPVLLKCNRALSPRLLFVQVEEKLLDLYKTVASVVPAAAKKR